MRAVVVRQFGGPEVMRVEEVPAPAPGAGQVLVRIRAAGINPVDTYVRTGTYAFKPPLPYTPGTDGAGEVEALGPDVAAVAETGAEGVIIGRALYDGRVDLAEAISLADQEPARANA